MVHVFGPKRGTFFIGKRFRISHWLFEFPHFYYFLGLRSHKKLITGGEFFVLNSYLSLRFKSEVHCDFSICGLNLQFYVLCNDFVLLPASEIESQSI